LLEQELAFARERHWMVYFPLLAGAFVAMLPFIIIAEKRRKVKPVFLAAIALLGLMLLALLGLPVRWPLVLGALFLYFMAFNLLEATLPSLVSKIAPAGAKGTATGIYSTCQFLGAFAGGALGGALLHTQGMGSVLAACVLLTGIWLLVAGYMRTPRFLASILIPLGSRQVADMAERLRAVAGVVEVVVVESEHTAYLKVDPQRVDRKALSAIAVE
jgi:MFS family permease